MKGQKVQQTIYIHENYGTVQSNSYQISDNISSFRSKEINKNGFSFYKFFMTVFLPHGYPSSVSKDYLQYQIWDSVQAFASSITGSICTHAVLKGAGIGDEGASPLAATITWLMKDGTSMVGRIVFAWSKGTKLDCECKKWRLFADVTNDLAMLLDLLSAYFKSHFMLIICISGLLKSMVGVAGGSTRAALTLHQARKNNMADVSAKDGSQETLVNLLALLCSLVLVPVVTKSFTLVWITYILMTILHLAANYFAVKSVIMETFNAARFKIFADYYFSLGTKDKNLMSVKEVNNKEDVFFSIYPEKIYFKLGCSFKDIANGKRQSEILKVLQTYEGADYILCMSKNNSPKAEVNIAFSNKSTVLTQMEALFQVYYLQTLLKPQSYQYEIDAVSVSREYTKQNFNDFLNCAKRSGFNTSTAFFETDSWRLEW